MFKRIILVRHGESEGNKEKVFRGRKDFPLTENGIKQAKNLAQALSVFDFKRVYTSPLQRALYTAKIIAETKNAEVIIEEGFTNIYLAEWEGKPKEEIKEKYPDLWNIWITTPENLRIPGIETLDEVQKRAKETLIKIIHNEKEESFVVVTHRAVLKPLIAGILGIKKPYFWRIHLDTASYSIIEYQDKRGFTLTLLNETGHLEEFIVEKV